MKEPTFLSTWVGVPSAIKMNRTYFDQGPVVYSIFSLTKSSVKDLLNLLVHVHVK